ncbi:MAG TPA: hypothetical protein VMW50_03210 [Dehalococcoidia bacterium]|nr:hypothetical protein [Dehalococcoidia bacterium]
MALPSDSQLSEVIGYIEECRDIHILWVDYLTENSEFDSSQVGDVQWHQEWVERYNETLDILYDTRRLAQLVNPFSLPWTPSDRISASLILAASTSQP